MKQLEQVKEFRTAFKLPINSKPTKIPNLHYNLLKEELQELFLADNTIEQADALIDIMYLSFGALLQLGVADKFEELFDEVHASNMSKLVDGKAIYRPDGKVLKGENYFKPNIGKIMFE